jgi:hypothetical protein
MHSCFAVTRRRGEDWTILTGVGFLREITLLAPANPTTTYVDYKDEFTHYELFRNSESWTFAFHDACWRILLLRLVELPSNPLATNVIRHLFDILHSPPSDRNAAGYPAYDFGGASQFWEKPYSLPTVWDFLLAEPETPCLVLSQHSELQIPGLPVADPEHIFPYQPRDIFRCLSQELVTSIANCLPSSDLGIARLSSRAVATATAPQDLPQAFWRSRFSKDMEMAFLVTATLNSVPAGHGVDWRALYHQVKAELMNTSSTGSLRNRKRIWKCLDHLTDCLIPFLTQKLALTRPEALKRELSLLGYSLGNLVRGHARIDEVEDEYTDGVGSRLLGLDHIPLNPLASDGSTLFLRISFITFNCSRYVCGLRALRQDEAGRMVESARVGLSIASSEVTWQISSEDRVNGIQVATTVTGVIGLACIVGEGREEHTLVAGAVHNLPRGAGMATLRPRLGRQIEGVAIGFDVGASTRIRK